MNAMTPMLRSSARWKEEGNAMIIVVLLIAFLAALATAQFFVTVKNSQVSSFFLNHTDLHAYAESGLTLGLHDLQYNASGNSGNIGTTQWTILNDLGRDGTAATFDEGEADGIPTPGESNVTLSSVGPSSLSAGVCVYVTDSAYPNIKKIVSTAATSSDMVTISAYARATTATIPKVGAVYVSPDTVLDLKGNNFMIDGNDHNMDGSPGSEAALPGIATPIGSPAGTNETYIVSQIPARNYDQVIGDGGTPSVDEVTALSIQEVFDNYKAWETQTLPGATYTDAAFGTEDSMEVTYVSGDLHLSGTGSGAGILLVDGSVTISGQFDFKGLVIVLGDVRLTGGGTGVHIYGSLMVGESLSAVESDTSELKLGGTADIYYSSEALNAVLDVFGRSYSIVYYEDED